MKRFLFTLLFGLMLQVIVGSIPTSAQQIRNIDFEKRGTINPDIPVGWSTQWVGHKVSLDPNIVHSGKYSFKSYQLPGESGYGISRQKIPTSLVRGKNVKIKVWMRTKEISNGNAIARFSVFDSSRNVLNYKQFPRKGVRGTTEWKQYGTNIEIDNRADFVSISLFHRGSGISWFDNIKIEINGEVYDPKNIEFWSPNKNEIAWLKNNAIKIKTVTPDSEYSDLNKLEPIFKDAKIIGLGEGTHGTHEFFRMKHRLIQWLAEEQDSILVALEAGMPKVKQINKYVLEGKGAPQKLLANLGYWTWNTCEMLDMIEWIRAYNKSGKGKIEFWGFDMQFSDVAAENVYAFVNKAEPKYLQELKNKYDSLKSPNGLRSLSQNKLDSLYQSVVKVKNHLQEHRAKYLQNFDKDEVDWAIQNTVIIEQSVGRFASGGQSRDQSMAENIIWIKEQYSPNSKMFIWAHNDHVKRTSSSIGGFLANRYGDEYTNVGFSFGKGNYSAVLGPDQPVKSYKAQTPLKGSVEYALHSITIPNFAVNLIKAQQNIDGRWLSDPKPFRSIGSIARDDPYKQTPVAEVFDILIYFDQTTATDIIEN